MSTPAGTRWPAEWEPHEATLLAWPHDETTFPSGVEHAERAFAAFAAAIAEGEKVHLLVADEPMARRAEAALHAAGTRPDAVLLHTVPTADVWCRDYGPVVVHTPAGRRGLDFTFNAWGGKYPELLADSGIPRQIGPLIGLEIETVDLVLEGGSIEGNGAGTLLTTEQCLLNKNRNPHLTKGEIEAALRQHLGVTQVVWLGDGVEGDDTDGHIDDITRFVGPRTVVTAVQPDTADPDHAPLLANRERLRGATDQDGAPLEIIELPMPTRLETKDGERLPASHANFYIANACVCVPVFGGPTDDEAVGILGHLFPTRKIVPIDCRQLVEGLGALHCVSQQIPR